MDKAIKSRYKANTKAREGYTGEGKAYMLRIVKVKMN